MLLGCQDEYVTLSWLLGKKLTGMLHQTTFKDMPSSLPTMNDNGRFLLLHPMIEFDDSTLKYNIKHENDQVSKIFDKYEEAFKWYREIISGYDFDKDRNNVIQEADSTEICVLVPRPVVSCDLMCRTIKDLLTYHNTQTPNASSKRC